MFRRKDGEIELEGAEGSTEQKPETGNAQSATEAPKQTDLLNTPTPKKETAKMEGNTMSNDAAEKKESNEQPQAVTPPNPAFRPQAPSPAAAAPRPAAAPAQAGGLKMPSAPSAATPADTAGGAGKRILTVGPQINMKGEITSCDRLVIEGSVDATLSDVDTVEITKDGSFQGKAEVRNAEISGTFDGDLVCTDRLVIHATGRVNGTISYSEIEIERGGQLSGNVQFAASGAAKKKAA